jgi:hypothetical protein
MLDFYDMDLFRIKLDLRPGSRNQIPAVSLYDLVKAQTLLYEFYEISYCEMTPMSLFYEIPAAIAQR